MKGIKVKKRLKLFLLILLILMNSYVSLAKKLSSMQKQKGKLKKIKATRKNSKKTFSNKKAKKTIISINNNNHLNSNKNSNSFKIAKTFKKQKSKAPQESKFLKFMLGFGVGFGLKVDASEELKKCFYTDKKKKAKTIKNFIFDETEKNNNNANILEKDKENQKESAQSFTKTAMEFFAKFKDCNAFKETFLTFVKNKVINIGLKGIAYIVAGPLGLILKGTFDVYKIISEIASFYKLKKQNPVDYYNLGSAVGKVIYYTQNILLRRKKRF